VLVSRALNIFNAQMTMENPDLDILIQSTRFLSQGVHAFQVFGLPAAAFAMYRAARPGQRKKVKGMFLAAALTSFLTGITEPIEFAFIFISPLLWVFQAFMAGFSFMLVCLFGVAIGKVTWGLLVLHVFFICVV